METTTNHQEMLREFFDALGDHPMPLEDGCIDAVAFGSTLDSQGDGQISQRSMVDGTQPLTVGISRSIGIGHHVQFTRATINLAHLIDLAREGYAARMAKSKE